MKHLLIDADGLCYKGAHKGEEIAALVRLKELVDLAWGNCFKYSGGSLESLHLFIETWDTKWNFRKFVAVTQKYKGTRTYKDIDKYYVDMCKKHLAEKYNTTVCVHHESEDAAHIKAEILGREDCIIGYEDKDVPQKAGTYYNYTKQEFLTLNEDEAAYRLWKQVATGDSTDCIPGCPGIGAANKFFAEVLDNVHPSEYSREVAKLYKDNSAYARNPYKGEHSYGYFIEQCRLIYLLREPAEVWLPVTPEEWSEL